MQIDKTTLHDLAIVHSAEEQSVFHFLNHTHTNGGREVLKQLLQSPLATLDEIINRQQTLQFLIPLLPKWPTNTITNGTILVLEKFYETPVSPYPARIGSLQATAYQLLQRTDYSLTKYTVEHTLQFLHGWQDIAHLLQNANNNQIVAWRNQIVNCLQIPQVQTMLALPKSALLTPVQVLQAAYFLRHHFKQSMLLLIHLYHTLDAYLSLATACQQHQFCFPNFLNTPEPYLHISGLYHLQLHQPTAYEVQFSLQSNFLFLTGANMAGKSTFIKAVGIAVYLAHLGMGVPAQQMELCFFDGLLSNIHVADNLIKGESYFFNEVQRVKNTIQQISDGKKWLILIDELFKGTNVQDAMKCSTAVVEGLRKMPTAIFILSTHLYEIGAHLQQYTNIQFKYFETCVTNNQLTFHYQLKNGISNDRLGYLILQREGVVDLLNAL